MDFQQYQKDIYQLGIDYKINPDSIHRFALDYKQSKTKKSMKNEYIHQYEFFKNGTVNFKLKSGKTVLLTLEEIKELRNKL